MTSFNDFSAKMNARHEQAVAEMNARHERDTAEMYARHNERVAENEAWLEQQRSENSQKLESHVVTEPVELTTSNTSACNRNVHVNNAATEAARLHQNTITQTNNTMQVQQTTMHNLHMLQIHQMHHNF